MDNSYVLYLKEQSKVCEDVLRVLSSLTNQIFIHIIDSKTDKTKIPIFVKGVPTMICLQNNEVYTGTQIFKYVANKLKVVNSE